MRRFEVPFPPGKERFFLPAQLVDQGDLFGGEIKATGGNPVGFTFGRVSDQAQRGLRLIDAFPAPQNLGVIRNDASMGYGKGVKAGLDGILLDAGDEMLACCLELIEIVMALMAPVADRGFSRLEAPQGLEQMPAGGVLLQVKVDEGMKLVFKLYLERPVAS